MSHRALRNEDLDFAVQRVREVLWEVYGEAVGVFDQVGVHEDLVRLPEVESELILLEELPVGFGAFAAHLGRLWGCGVVSSLSPGLGLQRSMVD